MKKLLIALLAVSCTILVPISAQANRPAYALGHVRFVGACGRCGQPLYQSYKQVGCEYDGCPVYGWATVGHSCAPSQHRHSNKKKHHHHH